MTACHGPRAGPSAESRPTIVSLNPCADAILAEVAQPGQLLAISHFSHDPRAASMPPAQARKYRATSGAVEEIAALGPDLVVGDSFTPPATRGALARLGVGFVELPFAGTVEESVGQVRAMASAARAVRRGEALVDRIERSLARAEAPAGWLPRGAIVWQGGGLVAGDDSLIAELLAASGFRPVAAARGLGQGVVLPLEEMLADPPAVIFAAGDARSNEDRLLAHPALAALSRSVRAELSPQLYYCGGSSVPRALARLAEVRESLRVAPR